MRVYVGKYENFTHAINYDLYSYIRKYNILCYLVCTVIEFIELKIILRQRCFELFMRDGFFDSYFVFMAADKFKNKKKYVEFSYRT